MLDLGQIPSLETKRLLLRRPLERDVDVLAAVFAEPSYMRFLGDDRRPRRRLARDRLRAGTLGASRLRLLCRRGRGIRRLHRLERSAQSGRLARSRDRLGHRPEPLAARLCQRGRQSGAKLRVEHASNDALDQLDPSRQRSLDPRRGEDRRMLSPLDRISRQAAAALRHNVIARVGRSRLSR